MSGRATSRAPGPSPSGATPTVRRGATGTVVNGGGPDGRLPLRPPARALTKVVGRSALAAVGFVAAVAVLVALAQLPPGTIVGSARVGAAVAVVVAAGVAVDAIRTLYRWAAVSEERVAGLERWVEHDPLTGAMSRDGIHTVIRRHLLARRPGVLIAVLVCELDQLRLLNESLGFGAANEVLAEVARRLSALTSRPDHLGRSAGGEFVIVATELPTVADVERLATDVGRVLSAPIQTASGATVRVSANVGATVCLIDRLAADEEPRVDELMGEADLALAEARSRVGTGLVVFDETLRRRAVADLALEQELAAALEPASASGELVVHYQPLVDVTSGRVVSVEALIRWHHPVRGMVHPGDFLPVAGRSRLILDLGEFVLATACAQAARWSADAGRPIAISVNLGRRQLADVGLIARVDAALAASGLDPGQLRIEIPEDQLDRLDETTGATMNDLRRRGVSLVIDDFGANQTALGALRQRWESGATISAVKIDRAFVENLASDPIDYKVVSAIAALARDAGLTLIAEGVETEAQAAVLDQLGITLQQGFFYCRPGPADSIAAHLGIHGEPDDGSVDTVERRDSVGADSVGADSVGTAGT